MTAGVEPPTLWKLNTRWIVGVGPRKVHRRYVGGRNGQRLATDGGQMVMPIDMDRDDDEEES